MAVSCIIWTFKKTVLYTIWYLKLDLKSVAKMQRNIRNASLLATVHVLYNGQRQYGVLNAPRELFY